MGLDLVEIAIATEEAFGITINNRDGEKITTVGELYRYVLTKLADQESPFPTCKSAMVFYRLRRALGETLGIERDRVRPSTAIEDLIASNDRRRVWNQLENATNLDFPWLQFPAWVGVVVVGSLLASLITGAASLVFGLSNQLAVWFPLAIFGLIAIGQILVGMDSLAVCLPDDCQSVRGMIHHVVAMNYGNMVKIDKQWNSCEVWEAIRTLVGQHAGVDPNELTEETSFVYDLGLD
ncbi:hypothetical protein V5E97_39950 [Singulisphaera sp. Ch08]|uniref:Carrier domain-containing protein n=1 Tax=Singulisphaera sp. Ch08 TaxID=3120278 RepID=A0AAU7CH05_9BACT